MSFQKQFSLDAEYAPQHRITKYVSSRTQSQLMHINTGKSPKYECSFVFPTELQNNSGYTHALEHLVFMGSEKYPYSKLLQLAEDLCMSTTSCWSDVDTTVYNLCSTGWSQFQKMLPVFMDYVFHPTLTDEAFTTEVHYIDPDSLEDKGKVYSEVSDDELDPSFNKMNILKKELLFSDKSSYRFLERGLCEPIKSLTIENIRKFHKDTFRSDNLCMIVNGDVSEEELLKLMEEIDRSFEPVHEEDMTQTRPFVGTETVKSLVPRFNHEAPSQGTVQYSEAEEPQGQMEFAWIGPLYTETTLNLALECIIVYMDNRKSSIFREKLASTGDPLVRYFCHDVEKYYRTILSLSFSDISVENLQLVKEEVLDILSSFKIDLKKMQQIIASHEKKHINDTTTDSLLEISTECTNDFVYGDDADGSVLAKRVGSLGDYRIVQQYSEEEWQSLYEKWFCENKPVIVIGEPSNEVDEDKEKELERLLDARSKEFSECDIGKLRERLETALAYRQAPVPERVLCEFIMKDRDYGYDLMKTISISSIAELNDASDLFVQRVLAAKPQKLPMLIHIEHYPSQDVTVDVFWNFDLFRDLEISPYYYVFSELFAKSMQLPAGNYGPDFSVCKDVNNCGSFIDMTVKCEFTKYEECVASLKAIVNDFVFCEKEVTKTLEKIDVDHEERFYTYSSPLVKLMSKEFDDGDVKSDVIVDTTSSTSVLNGALAAIQEGNYTTKVLPQLEQFKQTLLDNMDQSKVFIQGDIEKIGLENVYKPWVETFKSANSAMPENDARPLDIGKTRGGNQSYVYVLGSDSSREAEMTVSTGLNIPERGYAEYAALVVATDILQKDEGLKKECFWKHIKIDIHNNELSLYFYTEKPISRDLYELSKKRIQDLANGQQPIDKFELARTKCLEFRRLVNCTSTYRRIAERNICNKYFSGSFVLPMLDSKISDNGFLERLALVDETQVVEAINNHFVPLFDASKASPFITCSPEKFPQISEFLEESGYKVNKRDC